MIEGDWNELIRALEEIDERIAALQLALRRSEEDGMGIIQALEMRIEEIEESLKNHAYAEQGELEKRIEEIEANDYNAAWDNLRAEFMKRIAVLEDSVQEALEGRERPPSPKLWTNRMDATQALSTRVRDTFISADRVATLEAYCNVKWNWTKDPKGMDAVMYVRSLADQGRLSLDELNSVCAILGVMP